MKLATLFAFSAALLAAQDPVGLDLPLAMAPSADGKFILVLDSGRIPAVSVRPAQSPQSEVSRLSLPDAWLGLTLSHDGKTAYVGGGSRGSVIELALSESGQLKMTREMKASGFVGDVALTPDGRLIYAADVFANLISVINPQSGRVIDRFRSARRPYRIVFHPDGKSYFVSSWTDAAVYQYSTTNGEEIGRIRLGPHPTDMMLSAYQPPAEEGQQMVGWKYRLFVAATNTNNVFSVGIAENKSMRLLENISIAPQTLTPLGMTPSALGLSADQHTLLVACSDANQVAVVDVSGIKSVLSGFIPAAPYPVAVRSFEDKVLVATRQEVIAANTASAGTFLDKPIAEPTAANGTRVVYLLPPADVVKTLHAVAGVAPDFAVKLGGKPQFDIADPANLPPAGYIWTSVLAAGKTVQNYGVLLHNGQPIDLAMKQYSEKDVQSFFLDLKEGEVVNEMPDLILIQLTGDAALHQQIVNAVTHSKFASSTQIVDGPNLAQVERLLGLRPLTLHDEPR